MSQSTRRVLGGHLFLLLLAAVAAEPGVAQDPRRCEPVRKFFTESFGMVAEIHPDTMDDWRTHKMLPGCSVTAAGGTSMGMSDTAELIYGQLMEDGWTRTPDPRDAPEESSLRLRLKDTDCFFSFYTMATMAIGTEAERRVTMAFKPNSQDARFNSFVQCVPAMPADPR